MAAGINSALEFLDKVKGVYGAGSPRYQGFIGVLKDFKTGSASGREATRRITALFKDHPELIEGYAAFLPAGSTIRIPEDPQGNIFVRMTAGTMEIARDGTLINETHTQAPESQGAETKSPKLTEWDKSFLGNLKARFGDSEEYKAKYEVFVASFEAYLKMPLEQRKASFGADQSHEFVEKLRELLGDDDEFKKVLAEVLN